ncbi:hypothetical protein IPP75_05360 [Candidatus Saccharibacteria bacterium]|nr:MAG: hypothetical protein IPP75_05360 [Candidatus Saccharibacteria bacterium]
MRKYLTTGLVVLGFLAAAAFSTSSVSALTTVNGCSFDDSIAGVWKLTADCTSTAQINVPSNTVVKGGGHTISPNFTKTDNDNNAALGVVGMNSVTVRNLTIDGTAGVKLHGINVFQSSGVKLVSVILKNNSRNGLVVNGSEVTVRNLTTAANVWGSVDVDLGSGVTMPASLTVKGISNHSDVAHIYVDDSTKAVSVNDVRGQYMVSHPGIQPNDKLYTLKKVVTTKNQCKNGGWQRLMTVDHWGFQNQGKCVSYVEHVVDHHGHHGDREHEHDDMDD